MKSYRVIPQGDDKWEAFRSRDLATIERAIHEGVISPYDRDEYGHSPFDLCVNYWACGDTVLIENLLDMWTHAGYPLFTDNLVCMADTITTLWSLEFQVPTSRSTDLVRKWFKVASLAQDVLEVIPGALANLPGTWSAEERFEVLQWAQCLPFSAVFDIVCGFSSFSPQLIAMQGANGFTLMHAFAVAEPYDDVIATDVWGLRLREFFESCVRFGTDLHPRWRDWSGKDMTPLAAMICKDYGSYYYDDLGAPTKTVQQWLGALYLANADLEEYGRAEMDTLRKLRGTTIGHAPCVPYLVAYGPTPEDWAFLEMHLGDVYAGLFWHMVEHPEASIPGAWLDDEDQAVEIEDSFVARRQRTKNNRRMSGRLHEEHERLKRFFERMQSQNRVDVDEDVEE
ncbi:hypothetical protein LTR10_009554 [Elasticomyces elasticus]|uniref:Uncharacterized protein n=1 Tax=Elasticomyces elasticus TaxID=574655 RepID=A0AAN7ZYK8_9PEZI|nr:hypothetical protein LTR10_009554 [Elasticomyces elasticus]KAK4971351.1 hypothetical protein LTR42_007078 [Elasticomyces elasticus]KAK5695488.1 hypothetical protein LTR97_008996 [Elasticomyces elasticus]